MHVVIIYIFIRDKKPQHILQKEKQKKIKSDIYKSTIAVNKLKRSTYIIEFTPKYTVLSI